MYIYTDYHDVDEDVRNVLMIGQRMDYDGWAGIFARNMYESGNTTHHTVAFISRHLRNL